MNVKNLKLYRLLNKMSQDEVAKIIGVTQTQYSRLERGYSLLNHKQIIDLCNLYEITPNELLSFGNINPVEIDPLFKEYKEFVNKIKR